MWYKRKLQLLEFVGITQESGLGLVFCVHVQTTVFVVELRCFMVSFHAKQTLGTRSIQIGLADRLGEDWHPRSHSFETHRLDSV